MDLEGVNAKIERAREGIQSLEADIAAFCEFQRRQVIFDYSQPKEHFLVPFPLEYALYRIFVSPVSHYYENRRFSSSCVALARP